MYEFQDTIEIDSQTSCVHYEIRIAYDYHKSVEAVLYGDYPQPGEPANIEVQAVEWEVSEKVWETMPDIIYKMLWPGWDGEDARDNTILEQHGE